MRRKELTDNEKELMLRDLARQLANGGTADLETKGLTREEEDMHLKNVFNDIRRQGDYEHIHTIRVVPLDCDREPYLIVDTEEKK